MKLLQVFSIPLFQKISLRHSIVNIFDAHIIRYVNNYHNIALSSLHGESLTYTCKWNVFKELKIKSA